MDGAMTGGDQLLASYHPAAQQLYFERVRQFLAQSGRLDRRRDEQRYQELCNQHVHSFRSELQSEARRLLAQHSKTSGSGGIDRGLREIIQDYLRQFVRRVS
ncbi:hypothetical protein [Flaviaesturariibacter terrae]